MKEPFDLSRAHTNQVLERGITFLGTLEKTYPWIASEITRRTGAACSFHLVEKVRNQGALFGLPKAIAFARLCAEHGYYDVLLFFAGKGYAIEPVPDGHAERSGHTEGSHLFAIDALCRATGRCSEAVHLGDFTAARREALYGLREFRRLLRVIDAIEASGRAGEPAARAA